MKRDIAIKKTYTFPHHLMLIYFFNVLEAFWYNLNLLLIFADITNSYTLFPVSVSLSFLTRYLTEAVTSLDPNDPVTREHIPTVLESLVLKLRTFLKKQPHNKELKLLLMAATSLLSRWWCDISVTLHEGRSLYGLCNLLIHPQRKLD